MSRRRQREHAVNSKASEGACRVCEGVCACVRGKASREGGVNMRVQGAGYACFFIAATQQQPATPPAFAKKMENNDEGFGFGARGCLL